MANQNIKLQNVSGDNLFPLTKMELVDGLKSSLDSVNINLDKKVATIQTQLNGKQSTITSSTDLTVKTLTGGIAYSTTAPTSANIDGLKPVVLTSEPATKYDGWFYIITEE